MPKTSLHGAWRLTYGVTGADAPQDPDALATCAWPTIEATVPGNVEIDLMNAGEIEDPRIGSRVYDLQRYETYQWWYRRTFATPGAGEDGARVELVFEGLDCFGTVWLNGERLGETDNMLIAHRFDVTGRLRAEGENELAVRIKSATLEERQWVAEPYEWNRGPGKSIFVRKAPHMYGWDIMPRIISAGLWRDVYLETVPATRFRSVYWATLAVNVEKRTARALVDWDFATDRLDLEPLAVRLTLSRNGRVVHTATEDTLGTNGRALPELKDADLWWPRGHGEPALHEALLELLDEDGSVLAEDRRAIGLRTVELRHTEVTTPDEPGEFVFLVNGLKVFCRGGNWVPLDALHSRDARQLDTALRMTAEMNCNMIRVWGGGVYEDHAFFDVCDSEGIMVWQDFMFACHIYPQTDAFADRVRVEAEAVARKLRNHPSLVLWCGNNEIDHVYEWAKTGLDPNTERLSRHVLPAVTLRLDPKRPYLPSSPYRGPELVKRGNRREWMPEQHLYGNRPYFKDGFYTKSLAHFVGEIGYLGCPDRATLEEMLDPDHVWPWQDNEQWKTKAVRPHPKAEKLGRRIELMADLITRLFPEIPDNLDDFIAASQIVQAEAYKFWMEWWRVGKWRRTGMLWWQLRDGWPVFSAAAIDYYNRPKLVYYYLQRSQAPVCAIVDEPQDGRHPLYLINDTLEDVAGKATVRDVESGNTLLETEFKAPANGKAEAGSIAHPDGQAMWVVESLVNDQTSLNHYLVGDPPFNLDDYRRWMETLDLPKQV
jgi:beta-mannosidase